MKRAILVLLLLALPLPAQDITLPEKIEGKPGSFVRVPATTKGEIVRWRADEGLNLFPVELLKDSKTAVVTAAAPGTYRIWCWTAINGIPSEAAESKVVIGGPGPVPPVPPVPPGPDPVPPVPKGFRVLFVYESADKLTSQQSAILNSATINGYLNAKCAQDGWRKWDKDVDPKNAPEVWQKLWAAAKPMLTPLPCVVIVTDQKGEAFPLPATVDDTLTLLKKYGG